MSDVERMAKVIAWHQRRHVSRDRKIHCNCGWSDGLQFIGEGRRWWAHVAQALKQAGFGHVPTALHRAADALETHRVGSDWLNYDVTIGWEQAADFVRDRANQAGGNHGS